MERDNLMKMVKDLKDSEAKLVVMLGEINESDQKNNEIQVIYVITNLRSFSTNQYRLRFNI